MNMSMTEADAHARGLVAMGYVDARAIVSSQGTGWLVSLSFEGKYRKLSAMGCNRLERGEHPQTGEKN